MPLASRLRRRVLPGFASLPSLKGPASPPSRTLTRDAHRQPARPAPEYRGRSCRPLIGSLMEACLVFAWIVPMRLWGDDPAKDSFSGGRDYAAFRDGSPFPFPPGGEKAGRVKEKGIAASEEPAPAGRRTRDPSPALRRLLAAGVG